MSRVPKIRRPRSRRALALWADTDTENRLLNLLLPLVGSGITMSERQLSRALFVPVEEIRRAMAVIMATGQVAIADDGWRKGYVGNTRAMVQ